MVRSYTRTRAMKKRKTYAKRIPYARHMRYQNMPWDEAMDMVDTTASYRGLGAGELKFFDTAGDFATVAATGEINSSLNLIPQGVTEDSRIGRKCVISRLHLKGDVVLVGTAGAITGLRDRVRLIIYIDKQANGATAAVLDILETADVLSFRNLSNTGRFRVLSDQVKVMNCMSGGGNVGGADCNFGEQIASWNVNLTGLNIPIEFSDTTGALTEVRSNNIGILAIAEQNGSSTCKFNARVRFKDG